MARLRNPNRDKAFEIYKEKNGEITPREIAKILDEKINNINSWKNKDRWNEILPVNKGGAPNGNLNAIKHGVYCNLEKRDKDDYLNKYIPASTKNIMKKTDELGLNTIDLLWEQIKMQHAAILRSQKIMNVTSKKEMIKELKKTKIQKEMQKNEETGKEKLVETYREEEFEFQFAWDRQATFLKAQSAAMAELRSLIKQYEISASEEQKLKVEKMKAELNKITKINDKSEGNMNKLIEAFNKGPVCE
nr:MAG TPA: terminase small subunit [Caudoviricetes sp.]